MLFAQFDSRTIMNISIYLALLFTLGMLLNYIIIIKIPGMKYWLVSWLLLDVGLGLLTGQAVISPWVSIWIANILVGIAVAGFAWGTNRLMGRKIKYSFYLVAILAYLTGLCYFTFIQPASGPRIVVSSLYIAAVIIDAVYAVFSRTPRELRFPFWVAGALMSTIVVLFLVRACTGYLTPLSNSLFEPKSILSLGLALVFYGLTAWIASMIMLGLGQTFYERELSNEADLRLIIESSNSGHWAIDFINNRRYYSPNWYAGLGRIKLEDFEQWRELVHPDDFPRIVQAIEDHLAGRTSYFSIEHRLLRQDNSGTYRWVLTKGKTVVDRAGNLLKAAGSHIDISDIKEKEEQIYHLACHDALTGLLNRYSLAEELDALINDDNLTGQRGAFIFIDLDDFKLINDSFGHPSGDKLLILIAQRLLTLQNQNVTLARLGGDEFIVYLKSVSGLEELDCFMQRLLALFKEPFSVADSEFNISASVGVALYPDHGENLDALLRNADAAMYEAKAIGKNLFRIYEPSMTRHSEEKLLLDRDLRNAIANREFELHYQPILNSVTYEVLGFEALIRWMKDDSCIMPGRFIPRSEENGLIVPIGSWVLELACSFGANLRKQGLEKLLISVNISAIQIIQDGFVPMVQEVLERTGMPPGNLLLEITETAMMKSFETDREKLQSLRDMGVHLALDDFGTGYSSLNYLKNLPINLIKLDRTFIGDVDSERQKPILEIIVSIAHRLGVKVLAEGIETPDQYDFLLDLRCDLVQGYLFSYPLPASQALELALSIQEN